MDSAFAAPMGMQSMVGQGEQPPSKCHSELMGAECKFLYLTMHSPSEKTVSLSERQSDHAFYVAIVKNMFHWRGCYERKTHSETFVLVSPLSVYKRNC